MLTIGDFLQGWTGAVDELPPLPTTTELNSPDYPLFAEPSDAALLNLKKLLSYEAWLYLLRAQENAVAYDDTQGERDAQGHLTRVIAQLLPELGKQAILHAPVVRARLRWVQLRLLDDSLPKPYYQQAAEAIMKQARRQKALATLQAAMMEQATSAQHFPPAVGVAARSKWGLGVYHSEFGSWFVQELMRRSITEIEAYLTVEWRVSVGGEAIRPGDMRQVVTPDELPVICDILKAAAAANPSAKPVLKRARTWFMQHTEDLLVADISSASTSLTSGLSLRQIALLEFYQNRSIQNDGRARKLALDQGHDSPSSASILVKRYNDIKHATSITGVEGKAIKPMLDDLLVVQQILGKGTFFKLDNHITTLELKKT